MKIMFSADCFYPAQRGGPGTSIYWQAKALTCAGHDVMVVATSQNLPPGVDSPGAVGVPMDSPGAVGVPMDSPGALLSGWKTMDCGRVIYTRNPHFYLPIQHIRQGWRAIRQADVVHANSLFYPSSFVFVLVAQRLGKPVIWSPHGELSPTALTYSPWRKKLMLVLLRQLGKGVTFHATCPAEAVDIRRQFGPAARVCVLPNRMELPPVMDRQARPYLLFMGRLHPIKGIDRLLDALAESVLFRRSAYTLTIAGPDARGYGQTLREHACKLGLAHKVDFVGMVRDEPKQKLYANALLTVLPSHAENFGNVVIESLAQGTPVIAATGTPWQQLETAGAGRWVANQPDALRQAIEPFLTMPANHYQTYRQRAAELARQFDVFAHVGQWEQVYQNAQP